eukprot:gene20688-31879_t
MSSYPVKTDRPMVTSPYGARVVTEAPPSERSRSRRRRRRGGSSTSESRSRSRRRRRSESRSSSRDSKRRRRRRSSSRVVPESELNNSGTVKRRTAEDVLAARRRFWNEDTKLIDAYDHHDRAPEDRLHGVGASLSEFEQGSAVVRGTLSIEGVNYSTFEAHKKDKPYYAERFLDALRDDIISEVGSGVRREDVVLKVFPGAVKTLVLQYDEGTPRRIRNGTWKPADPKVLNADWSISVDYAIRARNAASQQRIAMLMFRALTEENGSMTTHKTRHAYVKWLDPTYGDPRRLVVCKPPLTAIQKPGGPNAQSPAPTVPPPATRAVSPLRTVPVDGVYPDAAAGRSNPQRPHGIHDVPSPGRPQGVPEDFFGPQSVSSPIPGTIYHCSNAPPEASRIRAQNLEAVE